MTDGGMPETLRAAPIGILGGTFDPVHIGHLRLAIEVRERLGIDCVRLIPLSTPNHRSPPQVAAAARLEMLAAAVDGTHTVADGREIKRGGVSYTVDTLRSLRDEFPENPLLLLLGIDAFATLCDWHEWESLINLSHIVVVSRPTAEIRFEERLQVLVDAANTDDPDILSREPCGRIYFQSIPLLPVSSTDIRARVNSGRSISHLVTPAVETLISQHGYYASLK